MNKEQRDAVQQMVDALEMWIPVSRHLKARADAARAAGRALLSDTTPQEPPAGYVPLPYCDLMDIATSKGIGPASISAVMQARLELAFRAIEQAVLQRLQASPPQDEGGPLRDGWQISIGPGHSGFGCYSHMTEYPDEGAVCLAVFDPKDYPDAAASPQAAQGEAQPFAKGSWQHAVDDHIVDYGRTSQEFATPHEAVQWLLKQTVEATLAVPTHPAPRGPLTTAELMAQEYEQWIRFHDAGNGDFTGFLRLVTAANNKAQAHGISTTQERSSHDAS